MDAPTVALDTEARDLLMSCIHESAHAVIARHYGGRAVPAIDRPEDGDPTTLRTWTGWCGLFGLPKGEPQVVTALSGSVACWLLEDPDTPAWSMAEYFDDPDSASATDLDMCEGFTESDIDQCIHLVRRYWPDIKREAAELAKDAEVVLGFAKLARSVIDELHRMPSHLPPDRTPPPLSSAEIESRLADPGI